MLRTENIDNKVIPTGNSYVAIPEIDESNGSIGNINVLSMTCNGMLELCADNNTPFIKPTVTINEQVAPIVLDKSDWKYNGYWIPEFNIALDKNIRLSGRIVAPPEERSFYYTLTLDNQSGKDIEAQISFEISLQKIYQTMSLRHNIDAKFHHQQSHDWPPVMEMIDVTAGTHLLSLAFYIPEASTSTTKGSGIHLKMDNPVNIPANSSSTRTLKVGIGNSSVAAWAAALEIERTGEETLYQKTLTFLDKLIVTNKDKQLEKNLNRNYLFARFYATGKTIDTEEIVLITSRSSRYYVSAAYWDRDSLLWLFPAIIQLEPALAKDMLDYVFTRQIKNVGIHSKHINGTILEQGLELDELMAPLVSLHKYIEATNDASILQEQKFQDGIKHILTRLEESKFENNKTLLYSTELATTDDPVKPGFIYLTYNNVLVWYSLHHLAKHHKKNRIPGLPDDLSEKAEKIKQSILSSLVNNGMFAWAINAEGEHQYYDEATGSLLLLPYFGFCPADDPTLLKTVKFLYSSQYGFYTEGNFAELGNRHTGTVPYPWVLSACNSILSGIRRKEGVDFFSRAPLDNGIACDTVHAETGLPATGLHFATCAGMVANALLHEITTATTK